MEGGQKNSDDSRQVQSEPNVAEWLCESSDRADGHSDLLRQSRHVGEISF
jgi:hypothetical protein